MSEQRRDPYDERFERIYDGSVPREEIILRSGAGAQELGSAVFFGGYAHGDSPISGIGHFEQHTGFTNVRHLANVWLRSSLGEPLPLMLVDASANWSPMARRALLYRRIYDSLRGEWRREELQLATPFALLYQRREASDPSREYDVVYGRQRDSFIGVLEPFGLRGRNAFPAVVPEKNAWLEVKALGTGALSLQVVHGHTIRVERAMRVPPAR